MNVKDYTQGKNILAAGIYVLRRNMLLALVIVLLSLAHTLITDAFDIDDLSYFPSLILYFAFWSVLAFASYSTVLTDVSGFRAMNRITVPKFVWRDITLVCCAMVPTFVILMILLATIVHAFVQLFVLNAAFGLCTFVLLSFVGTWLPAVVVGGDRRLSVAFARGEHTFERTFADLIVWAGPIVLVMAVGYSLPNDEFILTDGTVRWWSVVSETAALIFETLLVSTVAVVISRVFVRAADGTR